MVEVVPLTAALGARIEGLDRSHADEREVAAQLQEALGRHLLIVISGNRMSPAETRQLAQAFGRPQQQLLRYKRNEDVPDVSIMVSTLRTDGSTDKTAIRAEDWHTDDSYFARPAKATLLHAIEIPSRGGATSFCNMQLGLRIAQRAGAPTHRRDARDPCLRHGAGAQPAIGPHRAGDCRDAGSRAPSGPHPSRDRSKGALSQLQPARSPRRPGAAGKRCAAGPACRRGAQTWHHVSHTWTAGDVVVWDNRATMHRVTLDYPVGEERIMQRVLIEGERPV